MADDMADEWPRGPEEGWAPGSPAWREAMGREATARDPTDSETRPDQVLTGLQVMYLLLTFLWRQPDGAATVADLVRMLEASQFAVAGRPSKVISDSLRTHRRRGYVVRTGRGRYRISRIPPTTLRRARQFVAAAEQARRDGVLGPA